MVGAVPPESVNGLYTGFLGLQPGQGPTNSPFFELQDDTSFSLSITAVGDRLVGVGQAEGAWYESSKDRFGSQEGVLLHETMLTFEFDVPYCIIN